MVGEPLPVVGLPRILFGLLAESSCDIEAPRILLTSIPSASGLSTTAGGLELSGLTEDSPPAMSADTDRDVLLRDDGETV